MPAISLKDVSKRYRVYPSRQSRLKELLSFGKLKSGHEFYALKDIDLEVEPGTSLGVLGRNGSGKSTLLKVVSGVLEPTRGSVDVRGRLSALLQLGAGFNPEFTGRENAILNGLLLGLERREITDRFDEIEEFADLGEFMEQPVKTYSSGMRARLGFAVAVNVEPEILLVDETLSVGDAVFRHLGLQKMRELKETGTTILFVSHGIGMVKSFCDEALLLHKGQMLYRGETDKTLDRYQALLSRAESGKNAAPLDNEDTLSYETEDSEEKAPEFEKNPEFERRRKRSLRHGTGEARIENVELLDERGDPTDVVAPNSRLTVRIHLGYARDVGNNILGVKLRDRTGLDIFSTTTFNERARIGKRSAGERVIVDFAFRVPLRPGSYSVNASVNHPQAAGGAYLDWVDVAAVFEVSRPTNGHGILGMVDLPTEVEIHNLPKNTPE